MTAQFGAYTLYAMSANQRTLLLLIEASEDIQTLIKFSLESIAGLEIQTARLSSEGLQYAKQLQPDIIILDLDTPGPSILPVLQKEKKLHPTPLILLSSRVRLTDELESSRQGSIINLPKPFDPEELKQVVSHVLKTLNP